MHMCTSVGVDVAKFSREFHFLSVHRASERITCRRWRKGIGGEGKGRKGKGRGLGID